MKINPNFRAFDISAKGMGLEKKKMDLIAENIANINTTKTEDGTAYKRKYIRITENENFQQNLSTANSSIKLKVNVGDHIERPDKLTFSNDSDNLTSETMKDDSAGEKVFLPEHPDADADGYVQMPNINVVTEMVDMIAASRGYEANLTAFNSAKQIAKDSLEI